jgi:microcompartment protein CcmK/EutM
MNRILSAILLFAALAIGNGATIYPINIGTSPNDGTGDTLRSAFSKVNSNFTEVAAILATNGVGGVGGGVASNAIAMLNGKGTNTTITNLFIEGRAYFTNGASFFHLFSDDSITNGVEWVQDGPLRFGPNSSGNSIEIYTNNALQVDDGAFLNIGSASVGITAQAVLRSSTNSFISDYNLTGESNRVRWPWDPTANRTNKLMRLKDLGDTFNPGAANHWSVRIDSRTNYHAQNLAANRTYSSNSFDGLLQQVFYEIGHGGHLHIYANPYYSGGYVVSNTIVVTNWGVITGDGNPSTVIRSASSLTGPQFQIGTPTVGGIVRFKDLRFEGGAAGATGVGVKIVDCAEPVFDSCEFNSFQFAGIQINNTTANHWSYINNCWFVQGHAASHGILIDKTPSDATSQNLLISGCIFGANLGEMITVSNRFRNITISDNLFRLTGGSSTYGLRLFAGEGYTITGNRFQDWRGVAPIVFEDRSSVTNYSSIVSDNVAWDVAGASDPNPMIYVGTNVQGILMVGNYSPRGSIRTLAGTNGWMDSFDSDGGRVGTNYVRQIHMAGGQSTNTLLFLDGGTNVGAAAIGAGLTFSGGTLSAPSGAAFNTNQFEIVAATNNIKAGAMVTNLNAIYMTNRADFTNVGNVLIGSSLRAAGASTFGGSLQLIGALDILGSLTDTSTNIISLQTEDVSPNGNDFVLTEDISTGRLKKSQLANLPSAGTGSGANLGSGTAAWFAGKSGSTYQFNTVSNSDGTVLIVSNNNTITMSATNINTPQLTDDGVTYAKIQNVTASRIIGRGSAGGSGDPQEMTAGNGLTISGTAIGVTGNSVTQKVEVVKNSGAVVSTRKQLNFIEGANTTLTITDDSGNDQTDITIASTGGGAGSSNYVALSAGQLTVTNGIYAVTNGWSRPGTNLLASGSGRWVIALLSQTSEPTNIVVYPGAAVTQLEIWATNGTAVNLRVETNGSTFPAAWYIGGIQTAIPTNGITLVDVWTNSLGTNVWVRPAKDLVLIPTNGVRTATNYIANEVQILNSGYFTGSSTNIGTAYVSGGFTADISSQVNGYERVSTNVFANNLLLTNGYGRISSTLSGTGGANTNFAPSVFDTTVYIDGGTTNVNFGHWQTNSILWTSATAYNPRYIITNLTATSRTVSFGTATNRFFFLQGYDGIGTTITLTNKQTAFVSTEIIGSNVYLAWKVFTNGF